MSSTTMLRSGRKLALAAAMFFVLGPTAAEAVAKPDGRSSSRCHERAATMRASIGLTLGTNRADVIIGGSRRERFDGRRGADRLCGRGNADKLAGRGGDDQLTGAGGEDRVRGGPAADLIRGGGGGDRLGAGPGRDRALGGADGDEIDVRDNSRDRVVAGRGRDRVSSRDGVRDSIDCGPGRDLANVDVLDVVSDCERVGLGGQDFASPAWSDVGFTDQSNWGTIGSGDVDGDGVAELVGRSPAGIETHSWDADAGRWRALYAGAGPALTDQAGWTDPSQALTIQIVPTLSPGGALIAREPGGLHAWSYAPASGWSEIPIQGDRPFGNDDGFAAADKYSTIGSGAFDAEAGFIYGRESQVLEIWGLNPVGNQFANFGGIPMPDADGWNQPSRYSTIGTADVDGDGRDEIIARDSTGMAAWTPQGQKVLTGGPFTDSQGWTDPSRFETIQPADLDGDGKEEVIGRGPNGIEAYSLGNGQQVAASGPFSDASGAGTNPSYYSTIGAADLNGDGTDEVYGRAADGLHAYNFSGGKWTEVTPAFADLSNANLWTDPRYYGTIQTVDVGSERTPEVIVARDHVGVRALRYAESQGSWVDSEAFPQYTSGDAATAYAAINALIGEGTASFDLRSAYPKSTSTTLTNYRIDVSNMPGPDGVSSATWKVVKAEILAELGNAADVAGWYENYQVPVTTELFTAQGFDTAAEQLRFNADSDLQIAFEEWQATSGVLTAFIGSLAVLDGPAGAAAVIFSSVGGASMAAGIGAPDIDKAIAGIEGDYLQVKNALQGNFTAAINGLTLSKQEILGDYGLQSVVGAQIAGNVWQEMPAGAQATFIASAEREFEIFSWQSLTPAIWTAYVADQTYVNAWNTCFQRGLSKQDVCDISDGTNNYLMDVIALRSECGIGNNSNRASGPCVPPPGDQRTKLFGATQDGCVTSNDPNQLPNWDAGRCNLGVSAPDVYNGAGAWSNLPTWGCTGEDDPFRTNPCFRIR